MPADLNRQPEQLRQALKSRWGLTDHAALHLVCLLAAVPGLTVSSGRRSAAHNADVGGVKDSRHLDGRAVDLVGARPTLNSALTVVREQHVSARCTGPDEAFIEFAGTPREHLHVAW